MLADLLTKEALERVASIEAFARGRRYFEQGRVRALKENAGVITARVRGSDWYDVELSVVDGELAGRCSCPVGRDGLFCKHCVATGAAWIVSEALSADERKSSGNPEAMREYLDELPKKKLVDMLMAQARTDSRLRQRMARAVSRLRQSVPDSTSIETAIRDATSAREPRARYSNRTRSLEVVLNSLKEMLAAGDAARVVPLAALGLERSAEAAGPSACPDDDLVVVAGQFLSLHRRACDAARPDPIELARWVFDFETDYLNREYDGMVFRYLDVLMERGLLFYGKLAEGGWRLSKREPCSPAKSARAEAMANNAALLAVDPALMAETSLNWPDSPWAYYNCANRCLKASQPDKAVAWAELGVKAFPDQPYEALHRLLCEEYTRRGQATDALNQAWAMFTCEPGVGNYERLRALAKKAGQAAVWRDEALEYLKERAARVPKTESGGERLDCGSLIVEILLKEKDLDGAWREAEAGGCHPEVRLKAARAREAGHPADAIRTYQQYAEQVVSEGTGEAYRAAVRNLRRAADLITRLGQSRKFREYLKGYRERNRRKRNLLRLLDREFGE